MTPLILSIVLLIGILVIIYCVNEYYKIDRYEKEVKRILKDNDCPLYSKETMFSYYDAKRPAFLAADAMMTLWEKTEPTFRHNKRETDKFVADSKWDCK